MRVGYSCDIVGVAVDMISEISVARRECLYMAFCLLSSFSTALTVSSIAVETALSPATESAVFAVAGTTLGGVVLGGVVFGGCTGGAFAGVADILWYLF